MLVQFESVSGKLALLARVTTLMALAALRRAGPAAAAESHTLMNAHREHREGFSPQHLSS